MRLSRRLAITALTFVSAASLVACGGASDSTNSAAPATAASADTAITGEVTVFAAASLQDAFQELATSFEAAHAGVHITFDFQGSQDLVTALDGGSPADVLATANNSTMTDAANKGLVGEQTEFATNVLTLIVPAGNPAGVTGINDGSLDNADLVICAPEVPCGEATAKLADELGVTLNPVSEEQKVTDVRGKVESGEAQAGIVYTTDAAERSIVEKALAEEQKRHQKPTVSVHFSQGLTEREAASTFGLHRSIRPVSEHFQSPFSPLTACQGPP